MKNGKDYTAERMAQKWFARFKQGNFDMSDTPRTGRPTSMRIFWML
jgi:hypothetical protein